MDEEKIDFICDVNSYVARYIDKYYDNQPDDLQKVSLERIVEAMNKLSHMKITKGKEKQLLMLSILLSSAAELSEELEITFN